MPAMPGDEYVEIVSADDIRVQGTRVGLEHVLTAYLAGQLPEEIAVEFPTVTLEQVHGVIAYYLRRREEVDAYLQRWRSRAREARSDQDKLPRSELIERLRKLAEERVVG